ncbi:MAG: hypothetical protein H8E42_12880 [Nitrospinae bacterium]|nr:hypothetical protein [Nitrospinota bacterium]
MLIDVSTDLHAFAESLMVNVFIADRDFNLVFMNTCARKSLAVFEPTLRSEFQISVDDILGGPIHRFHRNSAKVEAILTSPSALPHQVDFEFGEVVLESTINAIRDETGQVEYYVVNWEDITGRKKLERVLNIKLKELKEANQELLEHTQQIEQDKAELKEVHDEQHKMHAYLNTKLGELKQSNQDLENFATIASHDLKTPVRKIVNFAGALLESDTSFAEGDKSKLNKILHAGNTLRLLIDDILEYSRLAGHSVIYDRVNLNDVMAEVMAVLSDEIMATKGEVRCEPLPVIEANKTQMVQLLQNLISNALKYRKKNMPPVVKILSTMEEGFINISVEDNGIGIRDDHVDIIFQPFERLNPQIEGTGMGLSICKKVVVSHGGEITVRNLPDDGGSVFNIRLPERHSR